MNSSERSQINSSAREVAEADKNGSPFPMPCPLCNNVKRHAEGCAVQEFLAAVRSTAREVHAPA